MIAKEAEWGLATDPHGHTRTGKLKATAAQGSKERIYRPDEISATEISLGRQRRKGRGEKVKTERKLATPEE